MRSDTSNRICGRVWKFGDSVDTDVISPGLRASNNYEQLKKLTMDALRPEFAKGVKPGDIVVAGKNFGCGSHRETANTVLRDIGIRAIVAESIARIYYRIGISLGIPTFVAPGVAEIIEDGEKMEIDAAQGIVRNRNTGKTLNVAKYPPTIERIFNAGGIIPLLIERYKNEQS